MKKTIILLSCLYTLAFSLEGYGRDKVPLSAIYNGWSDKSIKVNRGVDLPNVMQLLKAFHAQWPTSSVEALLAEAGDRRYVSNDVTECEDCTGHVFVDCDDFFTASYDNGEIGSQRMQARAYYRENGHTLFGICFEEIGAGQMPFCCFYDYDPDTQVMTPEERPHIGSQRKWKTSHFRYHLGMGYDQTFIVQEIMPDDEAWNHHFVFDGMKHVYHHSGEDFYLLDEEMYEEELPEEAELKDENGEKQLYLSPEVLAEVTDDEWSIWLKDKESGEVTFILTTNSNAEPRWDMMTDGNAIPVPPNMIAVGDCYNCLFIPWNPDKIFIEGCPDGRNVWSYIIDVKTMEAIQLPTNEGLVSIDPEGHKIHMSNYMYHPEGGRYSIERVYTADGKFTGEENRIPD